MSTSGQQSFIQGSRSSELRIGILCINVDPVSRESLEVLVAQMPGAHVIDNVDRLVTPREVMRMLDQFQHRVCVIDFDDGEESSRIAHKLHAGCGNTITLIAASSQSGPDQIIAAMRAGCTEYLVKPFQADRVLEALSHLESLGQGRLPGPKGPSGDLDRSEGRYGRYFLVGTPGSQLGSETSEERSAGRPTSCFGRDCAVPWSRTPSI